MRKIPLCSLALVLLALATGLTACGGDDSPDKNDYVDKLNSAQREFATESTKLNLRNPASPQAFKTSLDSLGGLLDKLISDLEDTEAPDEVTEEHDKLVQSLRDYDTAIAENKDALAGEAGPKCEEDACEEAARAIGTASNEFSVTFSTTIAAINRELK